MSRVLAVRFPDKGKASARVRPHPHSATAENLYRGKTEERRSHNNFPSLVGDFDDERIDELPDSEDENVDEDQYADDRHQLVVPDHLDTHVQSATIRCTSRGGSGPPSNT